MEPTPANLQFFFSGLQDRFWQAYGIPATFHDKVATIVPSTTEQEVYGWIGAIDKMREWVGPRVTKFPAPQTYLLANQPYELTESIDKFKFLDDTHGIYAPLATQMGWQAKKWPDYQLRDLLLNTGTQIGTRQNGTDGLSHWNTAHPVNVWDSSYGTYCNDFKSGGQTVGGILVGGALTPQGFATLRQEFMSRKGENGEPLGLVPNLIMVPPQLEAAANMIVKSEFYAPSSFAAAGLGTIVGANTNVLRNSVEILVVPELAGDPTTWYMFDTTRAIKPFIFQQRQAPNFVYRIQEQDPVVFNEHRYVWGVDARGALGWGLPWLSARSGP